jgi:hypothetical protein
MNLNERYSTKVTDLQMSNGKNSEENTYVSDQNTWYDILRAYRINCDDLLPEQQKELVLSLSKTHVMFNLIGLVVKSSRYPYYVMQVAGQVGMYIPINHRIGLKAYNFFIHNILYYHSFIQSVSFPSMEEIFLSHNRVSFLERYPDDVILKSLVLNNSKANCYPQYDDRVLMIQDALAGNFSRYGEWNISSNNKELFSSCNSKLITFTTPNAKLLLSIDEINKGIDIINKCLRIQDIVFGYLSVLELRQKLLEKCSRWKDSTLGRSSTTGMNNIIKLIDKLDTIVNKQYINTNSYLALQTI